MEDEVAHLRARVSRIEELHATGKATRATKLAEVQGWAISSQWPLYKLIRSNAFSKFVNECGMSQMTSTTIAALEVVATDFPDLDVKKDKYRYDEVARARASQDIAKALLKL